MASSSHKLIPRIGFGYLLGFTQKLKNVRLNRSFDATPTDDRWPIIGKRCLYRFFRFCYLAANSAVPRKERSNRGLIHDTDVTCPAAIVVACFGLHERSDGASNKLFHSQRSPVSEYVALFEPTDRDATGNSIGALFKRDAEYGLSVFSDGQRRVFCTSKSVGLAVPHVCQQWNANRRSPLPHA